MINGTLMKFLHLGIAANAITFFFAEDKSVRKVGITPTLSPRDPNFGDWYDDYQAKMNKTQRAPGGSEPGE